MKKQNLFERISDKITYWTGSAWAFTMALGVIIIWGISGPVFHYSDTWQWSLIQGQPSLLF